ncbi:MAG: hypothetical protein JST00_37490 [Deltaproteobacteria bacterium]|nr:hypothetical protein [Deltaproteobacteria bacterium]
MRSTLIFACLSSVVLASACSKKPDPSAAPASVSCFIADQHRCEEAPAPDKAQDEARTIECSSVSGKLSRPATCPTADFVGKCTTTEKGIVSVHRWYKGADPEYQKSACAEPFKGVWSTTF